MIRCLYLLVWITLIVIVGACTGRPISMVTTPGSTIVVPFDYKGNLSYELAYTSEIADANLPLGDFGNLPEGFDWQRGELAFVLCPQGMHACFPEDDVPPGEVGLGKRMTNRYISGVVPERASSAGLSSRVNPFFGSYFALEAQQLAILDVPLDAVPGTIYTIAVMYRPSPGADLEDAYKGSANRPLQGDVEIVAGASIPTPFEKSFFGAVAAIDSVELKQFIPFPQLVLRYHPTGGAYSIYLPGPAATSFDLDYPEEDVQVLGVHEYNQLGQGSLMRISHSNGCFRNDEGNDDLDCLAVGCNFLCAFQGNPPGCLEQCIDDTIDTIHVQMIDPDAKTTAIAVVFRLRDGIENPVDVADFALSNVRFYDKDGGEITNRTLTASFVR